MLNSIPILKDYQKPPTTISEQINLLESRGLIINNKTLASDVLTRVNYYRFSGYCIPFEVTRHKFNPNVKFEDVLWLYHFDKGLRNLIQDALELYENTTRAILARHLTHNYTSPFAHEDSTNFFYTFDHYDLLNQLHNDANKADTELFISHYRTTYKGFPKLPLWIVVEITTFGTLSKLVSGLKFRDQSDLASEFNLPRNLFVSSLHTCAYIRNICAHHRRLWNRDFAISMKIPNDILWNSVNSRRLVSLIYLLSSAFKSKIFPQTRVSTWKTNLAKFIDAPSPVPNFLQWMGLPPDWKNHPLWK